MSSQTEIPDSFIGKYEMVGSECLMEFLMQVGLGMIERMDMAGSSLTFEITKEENNYYKFKWKNDHSSWESRFRVNHEFNERHFDVRPVKSWIFVGGNTLFYVQQDETYVVKNVMEIINDEIYLRSYIDQVRALQIFKRVKY
ncbi:Lipocalin / cytosolic fatty-acid binding protein [Blomia tropicalis]|nr:Lipocalin / cytosolic fatty-acid binding protein [Blomia tropicalis]